MLSVQSASISTCRLFVRLSVDDSINVDIAVRDGVTVGIAYRWDKIEIEIVYEEG